MTDIVVVFASLMIVIGVILVTYWISKQFANNFSSMGNGKYLKVKDKVILGREKYLAIIQLEERQYLIGVSEQNITLLEKLDGVTLEDQQQEQKEFAQALKGILQERGLIKKGQGGQ